MKCQKCSKELNESWRAEESHEGIIIEGFCNDKSCDLYGKVVNMRHPEFKELIEKNAPYRNS